MKAKKSLAFSVIVSVALLATLVVACMAFAACGAKTYKVTWDVATHITISDIKVDGEELADLPESVKDGQTITFKATAATGWSIDKVTGASLRAGVYTAKITKDTEIKITEKRVVESITATGLTKTTYVAGDSLDTTGLVVTAKFVGGGEETIAKKEGTNDGYTVSPSVFEGGETEVTISYGGQSTTLPITVEYKVTIDTKKGTLLNVDDYKDLNNFKEENGVITFSYLNVEQDIVLPDVEDFERAGYTCASVDGTKTITSETAENITVTANWEWAGVTFETASLTTESETPYLIVTGQFEEGVNSAKVYLADWGDNTHSKNIIDCGTINRGDDDSFEAKVDLTKISSVSSLRDRWMTICFGEAGNEEVGEALQLRTNEVEADPDSKLQLGKYNYLFKSDASGDPDDPILKVYFNDALYSFTVETTDGETPTIKFVGKVFDESCYGGEINISWWITGNDPNDYADIDEAGNFTVTLSLDKVPLSKVGYAHVVIKDKDGKTVVGETETNLASSACTYLPALDEPFSIDGSNKMLNAVKATCTSGENDGVTYYVGNSFWDGILIFARNEKQMMLETTEVTLEAGQIGDEEKQDTAFIVFTGKWSFLAEHTYNHDEDLQALKDLFTEYSVQTDHTPSGTWWAYLNGANDDNKKAENTVFEISDDGTFKVKIALNGAENGSYWYLHYAYEGRGNGDVGRGDQKITEATITAGGQKFTFFDSSENAPDGHESWLKGRLMVLVEAADE